MKPVPRSKLNVTMATRQPSFSSPTRLATGHAGLVEEHLAELGRCRRWSSIGRISMPGVSIGKITQVMPLCFGASGSVRTSSSHVVGDLGERRPDLLAGDHVLVAVAHAPCTAARRGREPAPGSVKPWHQTSSPRRMRGQVLRPSARRWPRLMIVGPACMHADEVHADVGRAGAGGLLEVDQLLGERGAPAAVLRRPVDAGVAGLEQLPLPAGVVGPARRPVVAGRAWAAASAARRRATRAAPCGTALRLRSSEGPLGHVLLGDDEI